MAFPVVFTLVVAAPRIAAPEQLDPIKGRVVAVEGAHVSVGLEQPGAEVGWLGVVEISQWYGGRQKWLPIARLRAVSVEGTQCQAMVVQIGAGWRLTPGMRVTFQPGSSVASARQAPEQSAGSMIIVRSNVRDDRVQLDGKEVGSTPAQVVVTPGSHTVKVTRDGYRPFELEMTVDGAQRAVVWANLVRNSESRQGEHERDPVAVRRDADRAYQLGLLEDARQGYLQLEEQGALKPRDKKRLANPDVFPPWGRTSSRHGRR